MGLIPQNSGCRRHRSCSKVVHLDERYGQEDVKQQAMAAGFDYHLVKPVDPDALHGLVARLGKSTPEDSSTLH